jgi:hypothetical protein
MRVAHLSLDGYYAGIKKMPEDKKNDWAKFISGQVDYYEGEETLVPLIDPVEPLEGSLVDFSFVDDLVDVLGDLSSLEPENGLNVPSDHSCDYCGLSPDELFSRDCHLRSTDYQEMLRYQKMLCESCLYVLKEAHKNEEYGTILTYLERAKS